MTIPTIPQVMETMAPMRKATAVHQLNSVKKPMMRKKMAMKMRQMRYSCLRNSTAP
jgi:hypothetical protein